ncbi:lipocalin/fatty acid-binding family protein [Spirosoma validum]|uniref:Uncharacterized protein n=1 Tax=Spirosoma validum TaxID=2771355 RepID=A0A927B160_9BACT|nr:hypothetical protein [Spirosoma validum]MBD2753634.1 hypothetical protein [Spirosoma validum]
MEIVVQALIGTWFVGSSNFPMWLKGDKINPTFTYSITDKKANTNVLLDEVKYLKRGKPKTLTGFDYQDETDPSTFVWRGKGLLSVVRSTWKVALIDPAGQWAVIWFSKTLFTPEGIDIISRTPTLSAETQTHIFALMASDSLLVKHRASLRPIIHQ